MRDSEYIAIKERAAGRLLKLPQVTAVGLGPRMRGRHFTGEIAIKVFVREKRPLDEIPEAQRIPPQIDGVPTDVEQSGELRLAESPEEQEEREDPLATLLPDRRRLMPLRGGMSVAAQGKQGHGTIGCLLQDRTDPTAVYALTNHHVVSPDGTSSRSRVVSYPSARDSQGYNIFDDDPANALGIVAETLDESILDAAIVRIRPRVEWLPRIAQIGYVRGRYDLTLSDVKNGDYKVRKRGITSRVTNGVIACIKGECLSLTTTVDKRIRKNNIFVRPTDPPPDDRFIRDGDSGSVLVNESNQVVGLMYASDLIVGATFGFGIGFPIDTLFRLLKDRCGLDLEVAVARSAQPTRSTELRTVPFPAGVPTVPIAEQIAKGRRHELPVLKGGLQIIAEPMLGDANAATLGCIVTNDSDESEAYILTSYGAVSAEGTLTPTGDTRIGHPHMKERCWGCCKSGVATFSKGGPAHRTPVAVARLGKDRRWLAEIEHVGLIAGTDTAAVGDEVVKYGAATGLTGGKVVDNISLAPGEQQKVLPDSFLIEPHTDPGSTAADEDIHFARFVDRGAAVVDGGGNVVGILYDEVKAVRDGRNIFCGVAAHIEPALRALETHAGLALKVAKAQEPDVVHTANARVADEPNERSRTLPDGLIASPAGRLLDTAWREHERELRDLIDHNRRVATAWHRSGGPALLQAVIRAANVPASTLPDSVDGQPASACLDRIAHAFQKFGSDALRTDVARIRSLLPPPGGLSLTGWLDALSARLAPDGT